MSGRIHGEVLDLTRRLRERGLSRNAVDALTVIAEGCRDETRIGACSRARIADKLFAVEKTASRAIAELVNAGLVQVVVAGGGRGRSAVVTTYQIADLHRWLFGGRDTDRGDISDPGDIQMSRRSQPAARSAGHSDVPPKCPVDRKQTNRRDISSPSAGHPDVPPPVLPVKTLGSALEVTTRPREPAAPQRRTELVPDCWPARIRRLAVAAWTRPPRCPACCDQPPGSWGPACHDCADLGRDHRARLTEFNRALARARRACTECSSVGVLLGPDRELLDLPCDHPTVALEVWLGHDPDAPPNPPPVEALVEASAPPGGRHRLPDNAMPRRPPPPRSPGWRPSPYPRHRTPEGALTDAR